MKKLTLFALLLISSLSFAQLKKVQIEKSQEVGKVQPFGAALQLEITKRDNTYTVRFRDIKFETIDEYRSFSFEDIDNTFEDLYSTVKDGFEKMPEDDIMLELPNHFVWLHYRKFMGMPVMSFSYSTNKTGTPIIYFSNEITKKQVDKLFGKKK